ncbi:ribosome maturation factor RimP, partial [bacterium]|nr:ribosome maturation factor RimP [bacterium]
EGYELVELKETGHGRSRKLSIFLYHPNGFSIGDCARLSRRISDLLDTEDIIKTRYFLEVSSPGLDRKLETLRDFTRNIGETMTVFKKDGKNLEGKLIGEKDKHLILIVDDEKILIPMNEISYGKITI